jgi:hypothetical protein
LLQNFISRGFLYSFIGLIAIEEATLERVRDMVQEYKDALHMGGWAGVFMMVTAWLMVGVGWTYIIAGCFFLKLLYDRLKQNEIDDWATYRRDLARWKEQYGE